jgi:hypothetical protein
MLIFGTRAKRIWAGREPADVPCDSCARRALRPLVFQRYFHLFWIPCFPIGRRVYFECEHCKRALGPREGPLALEPVARAARRAARTPIYLFTGLAALAVLIAVGVVRERAGSANEKAWLAEPAAGDFYVLDVSKVMPDLGSGAFDHVIARVDRVTSDAVEVQFGTYGYISSRGAEKAIEDGKVGGSGYFSGERVPLERSRLLTWHRENSLTAVVRRRE